MRSKTARGMNREKVSKWVHECGLRGRGPGVDRRESTRTFTQPTLRTITYNDAILDGWRERVVDISGSRNETYPSRPSPIPRFRSNFNSSQKEMETSS